MSHIPSFVASTHAPHSVAPISIWHVADPPSLSLRHIYVYASEFARTHAHTHTHSHIYIRTYTRDTPECTRKHTSIYTWMCWNESQGMRCSECARVKSGVLQSVRRECVSGEDGVASARGLGRDDDDGCMSVRRWERACGTHASLQHAYCSVALTRAPAHRRRRRVIVTLRCAILALRRVTRTLASNAMSHALFTCRLTLISPSP